MLIELYGQNFGCFRDEFRLSMLATDIDPDSERGIIEVKLENDSQPLRLLRAVAIYGPNGSGKSTVLRAATTLRYLIEETATRASDSPLWSYEPFVLGEASDPVEEKSARLGVKVVIDGRIYDYEIQFNGTKFVSERLLWIRESEKSVLFDRQDQHVEGEWTSHEQFALISKNFRHNALLLSLADSVAPSLAKNIAVGIRRLLMDFSLTRADPGSWIHTSNDSAERTSKDPKFKEWLLTQLKSADLGVTDLRTVARRGHGGTGPDRTEDKAIYLLFLLHQGKQGPVLITYNRESQGTRKLIEFAPALFDLTHASSPHAVFVDEIDESLHPLLLQEIIRHFNCELSPAETRGQLIFVTHDTVLLDAEAKNAVLRRDQVYLTAKDASGAARLYSVAEFKERNNLNLRRRYLQGRYGALPSLGTFSE